MLFSFDEVAKRSKIRYDNFMKQETAKQFILYTTIGLLGALIDLLIFGFFNSLSLSIVVSQWFAATIGATHNHLWHHYKIFEHDQNFHKTYSLALILAITIVIISGPMLATINVVVTNVWASKLILFPLTGFIGFVVRKFFIFRKSAENQFEPVVIENDFE